MQESIDQLVKDRDASTDETVRKHVVVLFLSMLLGGAGSGDCG